MLTLPVPAGASLDAGGALHAYARARLADSDGALALAVSSYREALSRDPASLVTARRAYFQAMLSGDMALALKSAALLDASGSTPRDASLLRLCDALIRRDWTGASRFADRVQAESNFAFLVPVLRSWIAQGQRQIAPITPDSSDRFAALTQRYSDEHAALLALANGDTQKAIPAVGRALTQRSGESAGMRLSFAAQLAQQGRKTDALALLPQDQARFAVARAAVDRGGGSRDQGARFSPRQGVSRLLARLALDIASDTSAGSLGMRLARLAVFADPTSAEAHIVAARLLTLGGLPDDGAAEARQVKATGWYGALAQAELVDALAASGDKDGAISLARALADAPGAEAERFVRLGRLLSDARDFAGAAAAFHRAQAGFPTDAVPWTLLLFEGGALEQGERWDEARAVLERAATLAPNEPIILNYLGYAQIERRQNIPAALELLKKASALKPQDPSISDSLGWAQFVSGDVDAALPALERAAAGAPADVTINEHLGDALWAAGRRYEARYAWMAASTDAEGDAATRLAAKAREGLKPEHAAP
ncbi:tetratricopeptide repeat protein [Sphingobium sp. AN558]|uniref:tetratricopeptide repeat protein n=1 Tax=Sphingobium sp. AN558 TaxID=3133442 RepID=UPI0030BFF1EA